MIRRLAVVSGLVVLGAVALTGRANAQSVDINFEGTVPTSCTISKVSNGLLNPSSGGIDANANRGQVIVNCGANGAVSISDPIATTPAASSYASLAGTYTGAQLFDAPTGGALLANSHDKTSYTAVSNGQNVPIYVNMYSFNSGHPIPAGSYGFKTTVTVNPL